jgi:hypothetical protein
MFFFFGCWNSDNCDGLDYRMAVLNALYQERLKYKFGIVAGDNGYPRIGAGSKRYKLSTIKKGFAELARLNVPVYMGVGNHDLRTLDAQYQEVIENKNLRMCQRCTFKRSGIRFIFVNTNEPGYFDGVSELLDEDADWTIVVGHEPLFQLKNKKTGYTSDSGRVLHEILAAHSKVVYMCADVHNFQAYAYKGLPTIVVGTGGATPDPLVTQVPPGVNLVAHESPYGYAEVSAMQNELRVRYVQVARPDHDFQCKSVDIIIASDGRMRTQETPQRCARDVGPSTCLPDSMNTNLAVVVKDKSK